jgi:anti-sigma factor RsiW
VNVATPQLNNDDLDLLSAYIDNELTDTERTQLEARLQQEPALRTTLAELRATVEAVRALPPVRPPRSFTLDPSDARVRSAGPAGGLLGWLRALQLAGGVAAVVLVGALTLTLAGGQMAGEG